MHLEHDKPICAGHKSDVLNRALPASYTGFNTDHNGSFEYFAPFGGVAVTSAQFVPSTVLEQVNESLEEAYLRVTSIIVVCSYDGTMQVYYQFVRIDQR